MRSDQTIRRVGEPLAEARLTRAALRDAKALLPPGPGQLTVSIPEAETYLGRPDILLVSAWSGALRARASSGPRLRTFTEARVLSALIRERDFEQVGLTTEHFRRSVKQLSDRGWITKKGRPVQRAALVVDSLIVEAKVADWSKGLAQLVRERRVATRAALLVPTERLALVSRQALKRNGIGLLEVVDDAVRWVRQSESRMVSLATALWLDELALRQFAQL